MKKTNMMSMQVHSNSRKGKTIVATILLTACSLIPLVLGHEELDWDMDGWTPSEQWPAGTLNCAHGLRDFDPLTQKRTYYVGVHAPSGIETAYNEYQLTFETYLTETVGKRWNPPLEFKMKPTVDPLRDWVDNKEEVDFMYSDTGIYSCVGVEIGGQPLGTTISHLEARGRDFDLDVFGGSIVVLADNKELNSIDDLKDKVIAAQSISDFAGGQVQFYVMFKNGLDYIMDPKQIIFTDNAEDIVLGVLNGRWDVGFVRTGQIERTIDPETGEVLDSDLFKVLEPKIYLMDDGELFPFLHSTPVFPEWPLFARQDVDRMVSEEVSLALINFEYHNVVGHKMHECEENVHSGNSTADAELCLTAPPVYFDQTARCDTTRELAELAYQASVAGRHSGFRPARSHFDLRTMQQDAGFLRPNEDGDWACLRASTLYDGIMCPEGHFKVTRDHFETQCDEIGLPCPDGCQCYCRPCVKAFEVDVLELNNEKDYDFYAHDAGCDKMSLCATVQQTKEVVMRAYDNRERENVEVTALMHIGQESRYLTVTKAENTSFAYDISFSHDGRGVGILEVYVAGMQVPQSPFRVEVSERDCDLDYPGGNQVADANGQCECYAGTLEIAGDCVSTGIVAAILASVLFVVLANIGWCYLKYRRAKNDEMWQVNTEELHFNHPVEVIGQGSFGVVLLAEYRGTKVAIKRVLPLNEKSPKGSISKSNSNNANAEEEKVNDDDIEQQGELATGINSRGSLTMSKSASGDDDLDFLGGLSVGRKRSKWAKYFPAFFPDHESRYNLSILGTASGTSGTTKSVYTAFCPWLDKNSRRQEEFIIEMRLLSRLRHPCITTVMGAVVSSRCEPMMVMEYMENGSLYDLLRNETLYTGGEIIMQIVRDISQGLRFLHASKPPILHGDLKAKNILIDSRFRAKVADFGLATKTKNGLSGTPFWMAPEYLRQKTEYNTSCDIYAFGIIMYEIYSRKTPYEGQHPRRVLRRVCDPRINHRPPVPATCPPKMAEIMTKCWSSDPFFRPQSKDLDLIFMDMNPNDAEPAIEESNLRLRTEVASGDMLYKVFPKKVADKIKAGQKVEPETHEMVTVFFSDIVGFTDISRTMAPGKVCDMLDRLYIAFDGLSTKHEVFKVETIGDAWMGVTNLENDQNESHARRIAEFAVDAVEAAGQILIDQEDPLLGYVRIRVGFHSGQVVSNVIGSLNPRFGLFGDTVNTASRMESNSISGKIQCSEASANLLKEQCPDFPIKRRGKVAVKGKGSMITYWVGENLLKEEIDGSISRTYDEVPVVAFKESPVLSPRTKGSPHHNTRIKMDGSLDPPPVTKSLLKNGLHAADPAVPVARGRTEVRVAYQAPSSYPVPSKMSNKIPIEEIPARRAANYARSLSQ